MAQQSMPNNADNNRNHNHHHQENQQAKPMFHDFFGAKPNNDSPVVLGPGQKSAAAADARLSEASPSASASFGASSGGGRGPISTTSDLGSG